MENDTPRRMPNVPPFVKFVCANVPMVFDDSLSYYEALCALWKYVQGMTDVINNNATLEEEYIEKFNELKEFVDNYFANLDVQEEINNKLNAMVEDGTLQEIIDAYIQANVAWTFDSVSDMQSATNLIAGSFAQTVGFYAPNDGGEALYFIREAGESETADGSLTIEVGDDLIAELVIGQKVNAKQLGCKTDKSADCSAIIQNAIDNLDNVTIYFPHGAYLMNSAITSKSGIDYEGMFKFVYDGLSDEGLFFNGTNGFTNCRNNTFDGMLLQCESYDGTKNMTNNAGILCSGFTIIRNSSIVNFYAGINAYYKHIIVTDSYLHGNGGAIYDPVDSRISNCTINANHRSGIVLEAGANDNIISNNKIEWNEMYGITTAGAVHDCVIESNILDRNSKAGISISNNSTKNIITNNIIRRCGADPDTDPSTNIYIGPCSDNIFANNTTAYGNSQDDGSGTQVPTYALYCLNVGNNLLTLLNNDLSGGTSANPVYKSNTNNVYRLDTVNRVYDNLLVKSEQKNIDTSDSATYTIPFETLPENYTEGYYKKLVITTRDTADSNYYIKEIYVRFVKQYGNYAIKFSDTTIATNLTVTGSYSAQDGVVLTVSNASSVTYQVKIDTYNS